MPAPIQKKPTCTKLVCDYLAALDDFASLAMIRRGSGADHHNVLRTLTDLKRSKAIDCVEVEGELWWYVTPHADTRCRKVDNIKEGIKRNHRYRLPKVRPNANA